MSDGSKSGLAWLGSGITLITSFLATSEVLNVVLLIIGIMGALLTLGMNVWKAISTIKKASSDGKITEGEMSQIEAEIGEIRNNLEEIGNTINNYNKEDSEDGIERTEN